MIIRHGKNRLRWKVSRWDQFVTVKLKAGCKTLGWHILYTREANDESIIQAKQDCIKQARALIALEKNVADLLARHNGPACMPMESEE